MAASLLGSMGLMPYQQAVCEALQDRDARRIVFIRDKPGHFDRSGFAEWLMCCNFAEYIPALWSLEEVTHAVFALAVKRSGAYVVQVPHCIYGAPHGTFWAAMESLQDGRCHDSRYRWTWLWMPRPNLVVVGSSFPARADIGVHRWELYDLAEEEGDSESITMEKLTIAQAEERTKLEKDGEETKRPAEERTELEKDGGEMNPQAEERTKPEKDGEETNLRTASKRKACDVSSQELEPQGKRQTF